MSANHDPRIRRDIVFSLKIAASMLGAGLLLALARKLGWIDQALVVRTMNVVMGLALAAYGNAIPKMMRAMPRSLGEATLAQAVARVSSWAMTLAFLAWAALWAFAPQPFARIGSLAAVATGVAVMLGYVAWKCATGRAAKGG